MAETGQRKPVAPYLAVGLSTVIYGISERKQIKYTCNHPRIDGRIHLGKIIRAKTHLDRWIRQLIGQG